MPCVDLPPFPDPPKPAILIFDGTEHLAWMTPSAPGQTVGSGPDGAIAFINPCALIEHCAQSPGFLQALKDAGWKPPRPKKATGA